LAAKAAGDLAAAEGYLRQIPGAKRAERSKVERRAKNPRRRRLSESLAAATERLDVADVAAGGGLSASEVVPESPDTREVDKTPQIESSFDDEFSAMGL
jgi:hypothetical protein